MKSSRAPLGNLLVAALTCSCAVAHAEVPPPESLPCFPGAYYRKAVSSQDTWTGIEGVVTLPDFTPDPERVNPDTGRSLDNPSIYMGGRAQNQEIDAGVNYEVIKEADGTVSKAAKAYRPFWRNKDWFSGPAKPDFYYYPGDQLRIRIETHEMNRMRMSIELLNRGEIGKQKLAAFYAPKQQAVETPATITTTTASAVTSTTTTAAGAITSGTSQQTSATATASGTTSTEALKTPNGKPVVASGEVPAVGAGESFGEPFSATAPDAMTSLSVTFDAPNFGPGRIQEFKRVNAIDQSGNEGKNAVPTKSRLTDSTWTDVYLLRGKMRVPMSTTRFTDMRCPDQKYFTVFNFGNSNERVCIRGGAK